MSSGLTTTEFDVLNTVVLKKLATVGQVADAIQADAQEVAARFEELQAANLLVVVDGQALPTDAAGPAAEEYAAREYEQLRQADALASAYEQFERVNQRFLKAMQAWQQVEVGGQLVTNDHNDPEYDAKVIDTINTLVERANGIIDALSSKIERFGHYRRRFDEALRRIDSGETDYVSSPKVESVHNVWFELHEDLLRVFGKERRD